VFERNEYVITCNSFNTNTPLWQYWTQFWEFILINVNFCRRSRNNVKIITLSQNTSKSVWCSMSHAGAASATLSRSVDKAVPSLCISSSPPDGVMANWPSQQSWSSARWWREFLRATYCIIQTYFVPWLKVMILTLFLERWQKFMYIDYYELSE